MNQRVDPDVFRRQANSLQTDAHLYLTLAAGHPPHHEVLDAVKADNLTEAAGRLLLLAHRYGGQPAADMVQAAQLFALAAAWDHAHQLALPDIDTRPGAETTTTNK